VTAWLVVGLALLFTCIWTSLLLPAVADAESMEAMQLIARLSVAIYLPLGLLFLVLGVRRAYRNPPQPFTPRRAHTISVGALGALFLLFALASAFEPRRTPDISAFSAISMGFFGACAIAVVLFRSHRSPLAKSATAALNILWSPFIPFGTALFVWWLVSLRKEETREGAA
jgi:hypothetical protein